ncbi:hypothetical protein [Escherichia phage EP_H11]|nr:hypothetical protein [Escherichia phage EP_H11]
MRCASHQEFCDKYLVKLENKPGQVYIKLGDDLINTTSFKRITGKSAKEFYEEVGPLPVKCRRVNCNCLANVFEKITRGYREYCSLSCSNTDKTDANWQSPEFREIMEEGWKKTAEWHNTVEGMDHHTRVSHIGESGTWYLVSMGDQLKYGITSNLPRRLHQLFLKTGIKPEIIKSVVGTADYVKQLEMRCHRIGEPSSLGTEFRDLSLLPEFINLV